MVFFRVCVGVGRRPSENRFRTAFQAAFIGALIIYWAIPTI
ncbi:hypothetical protein HMPREF9123_1857 [Neisseria bacilliformis ATCC BAA-1200]|uniref:Uncharacterized protein n=1 Tax=Neisseria bacilliformis ATCC BAA-1200 TaxID=888742 RepID=F2BDP3_9NEIS|nr:hypothetical protein HMPREF9123_1857 [Neisseria bacilliformis ATCC BAA-1200]